MPDRELVHLKFSCAHYQVPKVLEVIGKMFSDVNFITQEGVLEGTYAIPPMDFSDFMIQSCYEGYKIGLEVNRDYGMLDHSKV